MKVGRWERGLAWVTLPWVLMMMLFLIVLDLHMGEDEAWDESSK